MVGIGLTFYGSLNKVSIKKLLWSIPCFYLRKWCFKGPSMVFMDLMCFDFTVAFPNKNNNNTKKKMEKLGCITKCQKLLKQLPKLSVIVQINKQH